jgi:hypothetical protein
MSDYVNMVRGSVGRRVNIYKNDEQPPNYNKNYNKRKAFNNKMRELHNIDWVNYPNYKYINEFRPSYIYDLTKIPKSQRKTNEQLRKELNLGKNTRIKRVFHSNTVGEPNINKIREDFNLDSNVFIMPAIHPQQYHSNYNTVKFNNTRKNNSGRINAVKFPSSSASNNNSSMVNTYSFNNNRPQMVRASRNNSSRMNAVKFPSSPSNNNSSMINTYSFNNQSPSSMVDMVSFNNQFSSPSSAINMVNLNNTRVKRWNYNTRSNRRNMNTRKTRRT